MTLRFSSSRDPGLAELSYKDKSTHLQRPLGRLFFDAHHADAPPIQHNSN